MDSLPEVMQRARTLLSGEWEPDEAASYNKDGPPWHCGGCDTDVRCDDDHDESCTVIPIMLVERLADEMTDIVEAFVAALTPPPPMTDEELRSRPGPLLARDANENLILWSSEDVGSHLVNLSVPYWQDDEMTGPFTIVAPPW